ncbi:MAG: hypothetical protein GXO36_01560 [Chloroflexi bacterium]|nr:hypothetical protein [Chloroflexota bacterium]
MTSTRRGRRRPARRGPQRPQPRRGHAYLLTGLLLGFGLGLLIAWVLFPVRYVDTTPAHLRADFKAAYRTLIALAYLGNPDLTRARARLALLQDPNPAQLLAEQAQRGLAEGRLVYEVEALGRLAADLQAGPMLAPSTPNPSAVASPTPTLPPGAELPPTPTMVAVLIPTATATRQPTPTLPPHIPTPTPMPYFRLFQKQLVCDPENPGLVRIEVYDARSDPIPGVELIVTGPEGDQRLYTGLKPEFGLGYADFIMEQGQTYRVQVRSGGDVVPDLRAIRCWDEAFHPFPGGWHIIFVGQR